MTWTVFERTMAGGSEDKSYACIGPDRLCAIAIQLPRAEACELFLELFDINPHGDAECGCCGELFYISEEFGDVIAAERELAATRRHMGDFDYGYTVYIEVDT